MSIPIDIHLESQYASSNRAKCTICGRSVTKDQPIIKILGFRINKSIHPECITKMAFLLSQNNVNSAGGKVIRSSGDGVIKVGLYEKTESGYRWKTITKVDVKGDVTNG
jgi:hypothetical protein